MYLQTKIISFRELIFFSFYHTLVSGGKLFYILLFLELKGCTVYSSGVSLLKGCILYQGFHCVHLCLIGGFTVYSVGTPLSHQGFHFVQCTPMSHQRFHCVGTLHTYVSSGVSLLTQ
uniref:Uncharacterized protein n=1 Tax=Cacopsylla melanoneura TaxID=428564 RepID=A0A8D8WWD0_9HEMI